MLAVLSDRYDEVRLLVVAAGGTFAAVAVSWLTPPEPIGGLCDFYVKARPPGFWKPVSAAVGHREQDNLARWKTGVTRTTMAALSIFCLLTGLGSWLVGSPSPAWFPCRKAWIAGLLLVGAALSPVWTSYLLRSPERVLAEKDPP